MKKILSLFPLMLLLTACPKEPLFYIVAVENSTKLEGLKLFINEYNPGDSLLPFDRDNFIISLKKFDTAYPYTARVCQNQIRGIRDCIESQPEQKIYVFVFDADTLAAYDYSVIRDEKKYKDRIEIPYTMATNDANLIIEYP
jgi:hypothetical protein